MSARPAYFTVSFDFELIWGTLDLFGSERFRAACEYERQVIVDRLLTVLDTHGIPATWFVVGHLMLEGCSGRMGHPEIVRPRHPWVRGDWFDRDPGGDERSAPLFFAASLVERIRHCPTPQEIGSHSFSHVIFGDPGCSRATAESELAAAQQAAARLGLKPRSMAFPRNQVGHLESAARQGFTCFRGPEPRWYQRGDVRRSIARAAHFLEFLLALPPPLVWPSVAGSGLHNVPGSMVFLPRHGIRRAIPVQSRVRRAVRGLELAVQQGGLFHLWMHPTNLADDAEAMLAGLGVVLARAAELRAAGQLRFATVSQMAEVAAKAGV